MRPNKYPDRASGTVGPKVPSGNIQILESRMQSSSFLAGVPLIGLTLGLSIYLCINLALIAYFDVIRPKTWAALIVIACEFAAMPHHPTNGIQSYGHPWVFFHLHSCVFFQCVD